MIPPEMSRGMKIRISNKRVTRASTGTSMALGQKLAHPSSDTRCVNDNIRKNCTKKSQIGYGSKRKTSIISKPITLKRIQKFQESRIKVEAINAEILLQAREKEINDELKKRIAYLEKQISSMNHATINILKNSKIALSNVPGASAKKSKSEVNEGTWVTIEENIVGVSAIEAGTKMNDAKWVTIEEDVIGWKPMIDSNEEERRSILLMKYIVDNFKRKSQSKNLLAKRTLELVVDENFQRCASKYA